VVTFLQTFFAVASYSCKVNTMVFVVVSKVNLLNRHQILITQVKAPKFGTY